MLKVPRKPINVGRITSSIRPPSPALGSSTKRMPVSLRLPSRYRCRVQMSGNARGGSLGGGGPGRLPGRVAHTPEPLHGFTEQSIIRRHWRARSNARTARRKVGVARDGEPVSLVFGQRSPATKLFLTTRDVAVNAHSWVLPPGSPLMEPGREAQDVEWAKAINASHLCRPRQATLGLASTATFKQAAGHGSRRDALGPSSGRRRRGIFRRVPRGTVSVLSVVGVIWGTFPQK